MEVQQTERVCTVQRSPEPADDDVLLNSKQVRTRHGQVTDKCLRDWIKDPDVAFPEPDFRINERRYWKLGTIRRWQALKQTTTS